MGEIYEKPTASQEYSGFPKENCCVFTIFFLFWREWYKIKKCVESHLISFPNNLKLQYEL